MTRLVAALAALLGLCLPARAAPFDDYQLIMWQEHTPAEVEGLARLGFTATKLRATNGEVDPAELAQHIAAGLPWYLENIATDLFATYHRYTPGQRVTWRFDAAKARRAQDRADTSVFRREPSLSDPAWQDRIAARLRDLVAQQRRYDPLFYNLADEAGIGDLAAAWDDDIGPQSLAGMRAWLRTQYADLAALNAEWGTRFAAWDDVTPELTDAALARTDGNYAAWADFKQWMDVAFADAVRAGTDALHGADPAALAGLEGGQLPGWGGYDYFRLAHAVDVFEIYDTAESQAIAHAANPGLVLLRTSFGRGDEADAWRAMINGGRGTIVWDEGNDVVHPDGSPGPRGLELQRLVASLRSAAPQLIGAQPSFDPVAVLVSQQSFRVQWLLDRRPGGPAWSDRDAGREYEDNAWRAARRETLARLRALGVEPHLPGTVDAAALAGLRVLILPGAIALSDAEVDAIRAFAAGGGTVLATTEPGLFDGHGRLRPAAPLRGVATIPEPLLRNGAPPDPGNLDAVAGLLAAAGAPPRTEFRTAAGQRAAGLEAHWLQKAGLTLLTLQSATPQSAPPPLTLSGSALRPIALEPVTLDPVTPALIPMVP